MQCPMCTTQTPFAKKAVCRSCDYRFGLDPTLPHHLTDADYLTLVERATSGGRYFFTQNQLYLYYCIERMPRNTIWPIAGILTGLLGHYLAGPEVAVMGAVSVAGLVYYGTRSWRPPPRVVLENLHEDMKAAGHPIKRYIEKPLFEFREEEKYTEHLPDPLDIEHLIIVDRNPLVDLLVLNDFAKHSRSLIISQSGYPNYVIPIAKELLAKRKALTVYLLHDSTQNRIAMKRNVAEFTLLPTAGHPMFNLGLEPAQVVYMKHLSPIQPARTKYGIPLDSIPYAVLETALMYSITRGVPLLTGFAANGFVGRKQ